MLPESHPELTRIIHREIYREVAHNRLIELALSSRESHPTIHILARLGGWLVERGQTIESRYRLEPVPVRQLR